MLGVSSHKNDDAFLNINFTLVTLYTMRQARFSEDNLNPNNKSLIYNFMFF